MWRRSWRFESAAVVRTPGAECASTRPTERAPASLEVDERNFGGLFHPRRGDLVELTGLAQAKDRVVDAFLERVVLLQEHSPRLALGGVHRRELPDHDRVLELDGGEVQ